MEFILRDYLQNNVVFNVKNIKYDTKIIVVLIMDLKYLTISNIWHTPFDDRFLRIYDLKLNKITKKIN